MSPLTQDEIAFAKERSHRISQIANEHARATSQVCVLINGGAATAMLAVLAKEEVGSVLMAAMPKALFGYASGVFFGALMMWCMTQTLENWNLHWYYRVHKEEEVGDETHAHFKTEAERWNRGTKFCFLMSMGCFIAASIYMAAKLYFTPVPSATGSSTVPASSSQPRDTPAPGRAAPPPGRR